jgi:hypothetical protein
MWVVEKDKISSCEVTSISLKMLSRMVFLDYDEDHTSDGKGDEKDDENENEGEKGDDKERMRLLEAQSQIDWKVPKTDPNLQNDVRHLGNL